MWLTAIWQVLTMLFIILFGFIYLSNKWSNLQKGLIVFMIILTAMASSFLLKLSYLYWLAIGIAFLFAVVVMEKDKKILQYVGVIFVIVAFVIIVLHIAPTPAPGHSYVVSHIGEHRIVYENGYTTYYIPLHFLGKAITTTASGYQNSDATAIFILAPIPAPAIIGLNSDMIHVGVESIVTAWYFKHNPHMAIIKGLIATYIIWAILFLIGYGINIIAQRILYKNDIS